MSKTLKIGIILLVLLCLGLITITILGTPISQKASGFAVFLEETPPPSTTDPDLVTAVESALAEGTGQWQANEYQVDHIQVQDNGQMAMVWLAATDLETGELLGREPELALAQLGTDGLWQVLLEDDEKFTEAIKGFQYTEKSIQGDLTTEAEALPKAGTVYGGYYLPWAADLRKRLTWSVAHSSCSLNSCSYAFDFADGTMFPLVATKGGTVYHWKDSCNNGDTYCTNSITLQDRSTTPWTYQIYLHIAKNSIPSNLKQVGKTVLQGQYIATVDDTGYSTGHHVHFMVVSEATRYLSGSGYIWGRSEDITFRDVNINWHSATQGGRPRLQYEADIYGGQGQTYYTSGNKPAFPPTGGLTVPVTKTTVTSRNLTVSGWGQDDISVVKMEILADYNGSWVQVGAEQTANPFTTTVDLCSTSIPDGPFNLAMRVWDYEGNPSPIMTPRKLIKNVECGASGSDPTANLILKEGTLALPQNGFVSASVTKGSAGSAIASVEFWFHGQNWTTDNWVYLGKDTNGANGWQAPITTTGLNEGSNYTILAVATDAAGKQGAAVNFQAVVDKTGPWINIVPVSSPVMQDSVTITWTGGDALSGLDYYSLAVNVNSAGYQMLEANLARAATSYTFAVDKEQLLVFELIAYDKLGNATSRKVALYTDGYVFPNSYLMPMFFSGN